MARLPHAARCTGSASTGRGGRHDCRLHADTALDGRVLCRRHLARALSDVDERTGDPGEDVPLAAASLAADCAGRGALLEDVLDHLRRGVPDPVAEDPLVLAVVPAALIGRIEEALRPGR